MPGNDLTRYLKFRELMKSGDGLIYRGDDITSLTIAAFSGGYSHCGMISVLPEHEGLRDRRWTVDARGSGVGLHCLSGVLERYHGSCWWLPLDLKFDPLRERLEGWALDQDGTGYDFEGIAKNVFGLVSADMARLFCSELLFLAFRSVGLVEGGKAPRPGAILTWPVYPHRLLFIAMLDTQLFANTSNSTLTTRCHGSGTNYSGSSQK